MKLLVFAGETCDCSCVVCFGRIRRWISVRRVRGSMGEGTEAEVL